MANATRAVLESALRARKLDRTLTTALPPLAVQEGNAVATGVEPLDASLHGGLPRGQLSELAGAPSSGRTTLLLQLIAAATARGEIVALVDTCDRLDVASAVAAGIDLEHVLWVRGTAGAGGAAQAVTASRHTIAEMAVERALKALTLVLQAGGFGIVALDLADVPAAALRRLPFTTWMRVQRMVEGRETACVLLVREPLARSAGGLTLSLDGGIEWGGAPARSRYLERLTIAARVVSPRRRLDAHVTVGALAVDSR